MDRTHSVPAFIRHFKAQPNILPRNSKKNSQLLKEWKELTLTDDYLFSQIMKDEEFCKLFLEMLMGIKITKVIYLEAQKEVNLFPQTKGIRMDVYLEGDNEIYNIEMQTTNKYNLVKRMRYYHSAIDVDSLLRGNPYDQLKKSYVIFICNFDLCGDGFPVYGEIGDEQIKVVYNTSAFEKAQDPRLRALLQYLSTATVTDEARPIADKVAAFKRLFPDGRPHMKYELDLYDKWREGRAEGIKEGIEQGLTQGRQEGIEIGEERGIAKGREDGILTVVYTAFEQGLSTEVIASLTHMSIEEIEKLRDTFSV